MGLTFIFNSLPQNQAMLRNDKESKQYINTEVNINLFSQLIGFHESLCPGTDGTPLLLFFEALEGARTYLCTI